MHILVTYASRYGSTEQVAQWIADKLSHKAKVDLQEVSEESNLSKYSYIIIGSPLYYDAILPEMQKFIAENKEVLRRKLIGVFALALVHIGEALYSDQQGVCLDRFEQHLPTRPLYAKLFEGSLDPSGLSEEDHEFLLEYYQSLGEEEVPFEQRINKEEADNYSERFLHVTEVRERLKNKLN